MLTIMTCLLTLSVSAPLPKQPPKNDDPSLIGEWSYESGMSKGKVIPDLKAGDVRLIFTDKKEVHVIVRVENKLETLIRTFNVDAGKNPPELNMYPPDDEDEPPGIGIYKIEKDTLTLCLDEEGKSRPQLFEAPEKKPSISLMKFKRLPSK
jgi:uncharacterized protein (TIGR03067 family)